VERSPRFFVRGSWWSIVFSKKDSGNGRMKFTKSEDIDSWKEARKLTCTVYELTTGQGFHKDFGLRDQIQRTAVSIMANIAEGFDSGTNRSVIGFLNYAYRSASEVQSLLYVALDQSYIETSAFQINYDQAGTIKNLIGGLIKYLKSNLR